jgi:hypothetical protein
VAPPLPPNAPELDAEEEARESEDVVEVEDEEEEDVEEEEEEEEVEEEDEAPAAKPAQRKPGLMRATSMGSRAELLRAQSKSSMTHFSSIGLMHDFMFSCSAATAAKKRISVGGNVVGKRTVLPDENARRFTVMYFLLLLGRISLTRATSMRVMASNPVVKPSMMGRR